MNMNYFIDFEAASPIPEIISIGCVREDGKEFYSLVKPAEAIVPKKITELTGITSAMLESAPSAIEVFTDFYNWLLKDDSLPNFYCYGNSDIDFIRSTFKRTKDKTARLALGYIAGSLRDYNKTFCKRAGVQNCSLINAFRTLIDSNAIQIHNALDDAIMLMNIYKYADNHTPSELKKKMGGVTLIEKENLSTGTIYTINNNNNINHTFIDIEAATAFIIAKIKAKNENTIIKENNIKKKILKYATKNQNLKYHNLKWRIK